MPRLTNDCHLLAIAVYWRANEILSTQGMEGQSPKVRQILPKICCQAAGDFNNKIAWQYHPLYCLEPYPEHREHWYAIILVEDKIAEPCAMLESSDSSVSSTSATSEKDTAVFLTQLFDGK